MDQARKIKNRKLREAAVEVGGGIIGIEATIYVAGTTIPVLAAEVVEGSDAISVASGLMETSRSISLAGLKSLLFGGLYVKGIVDATRALNEFDRAVADCQFKYGYPNVP